MLSKSFRLSSSEKTKNYNNVPSIKSIFSPISKSTNISSSILICSKLPIISTSFMNTVTVELYKVSLKNKEHFPKKRPFLSLDSFFKLSKFLTSTILCIEI